MLATWVKTLYRGRQCRGYVVLWRDSGLRDLKKLERYFSHTEDSLRWLCVERAKNTSAPLPQDGRSCLQPSAAVEKRFAKRIYMFRNPQKMKDKNAFILSSEFRAFIIVMTFVAVSGKRLIDNWQNCSLETWSGWDLIRPFWALLFIKKLYGWCLDTRELNVPEKIVHLIKLGYQTFWPLIR